MRNLLTKATALVVGTLATGTALAQSQYDSLTAAVSWADVADSLIGVGVAIIGIFVVFKGIKLVVRSVKGA